MPNESQQETIKVIQCLRTSLEHVEGEVKKAKLIIEKREKGESIILPQKTAPADKSEKKHDEDIIQVIEGIFDGYFMKGDDKKEYPVPLNYASKSKLVPGDKLKLRIKKDGKMIYKLILACERNHEKATLSLSDDHKPIAITPEGKIYFLNQAAVTYFKGKAGDDIYILTNKEQNSTFAAIEAIMKSS